MAEKLSMAQRRVLERLADGEGYFFSSGARAHANFTKGGTVRLDTSHALWRRGFVVSEKQAALGVSIYSITPAGRLALEKTDDR